MSELDDLARAAESPKGGSQQPQRPQFNLIRCADCGAQVSPRALECPKCGGPIEAPPPPRHRVQTVQQTGKGWKAMMVIGFLGMIAGCMGTCGGIAAAGKPGGGSNAAALISVVSIFLLVGGLVLFCFARIGAWWNHG